MTYQEFIDKSKKLGYCANIHFSTNVLMGINIIDTSTFRNIGYISVFNNTFNREMLNTFSIFGQISNKELVLINKLVQTPIESRNSKHKLFKTIHKLISLIQANKNISYSYSHYCQDLLHYTDALYSVIKEQHDNLKDIKKMLKDVLDYVEFGKASINIISNDFNQVAKNLTK